MSGLSQLFQKYKNHKIAVYGLGTETEKVLQEIGQEFQIVGLLDSYQENGMLYGLRIIPLKEALECGVKLILVVARPGSCRAIAKRIGKICAANQISLIDVRGKDLCVLKKAAYDFKGTVGIVKSHLQQQIKECDAVSVDLFDTLIMRQTMFPTDVPNLVDHKLREKGIVIEDFFGRRLESEKRLSKFTAPTLTQIYSHMESICSIQGITPEELAGLEWEMDYRFVVPRWEMCGVIAEAFSQGKEVYIVSDTYYTKDQVAKLLEKCSITSYTDILASCEYRTGKTQGLFGRLKERLHGRRCIHIGDDVVADVESAERNGIVSCQIYSGLELLEMAGYMGLWDSMEGLADRIKVGMFVSRLFNSPFQFETEGREICIRSAYDAGYLFFAPIISDFVIWFAEQVERYRLRNVWFSARDGYLIKELYDELRQGNSSVYFLVSRIAAIRAGVENEDDIRYVSDMKFSGTLQEQMQERFGFTVSDTGADGDNSVNLLDYTREILDRATVCRENYQAYIRKLDMDEGDIAFFDFVAKGTSQMYIGRLVKKHLKGLYFLQLEEEFMKENGMDIIPFYEAEEKEGSEIYESYYILETILSSHMPSVKGFDGQGQPYYAEETRGERDIACVRQAQEGILGYFRTYKELCPELESGVNKKLDELLLSLVHNISILDQNFCDLKVEDPFFNRVTDVVDLI